MPARRQWSNTLKVFKEKKCSNENSICSENILPKLRQNKDLFRKAEEVHQQTYTAKKMTKEVL